MAGFLTLKIVEGKLTRNTELFGNMDPFIQIEYRDQKFRTKVNDGGGLTPTWNETFMIPIFSVEDLLIIVCKDKDLLIDDFIGKTEIEVQELCAKEIKCKWISLFCDGTKSG